MYKRQQGGCALCFSLALRDIRCAFPSKANILRLKRPRFDKVGSLLLLRQICLGQIAQKRAMLVRHGGIARLNLTDICLLELACGEGGWIVGIIFVLVVSAPFILSES